MAYHKYIIKRGFSLIEVLIVSTILLIFFAGLFGSVKYTLGLVSDSKAKLTALTVANDEMEYVRSLAYDSIGTVAGIPAGLIPQLSTTSLNIIDFEKRVLIEYIDDDADGLGASDSNGITTDYKQVKVSVTWEQRGVLREVFLVSNIIPRSIETSVGGGTLRVNVLDSDVVPLPGATVRVVNNTLSPNIDVSRTTDASGIALFGGAPAGPDYEIFVSAPGYSSDQTYFATTSLANPATQPVAVLEADISTMTFFIDELSELTVRTLSNRSEQTILETFSDLTGVATSTNVATSSGSIVLQGGPGSYASAGSFFLSALTPSPILDWNIVESIGSTPANTTALIRLYTGTSTYTLVPEIDLPGNAAGFSVGTLDIRGLPVGMYPTLTVGIELTTTNSAVTSQVDSISMSYLESETLQGSAPLTVTGTKILGTNSGGAPVYKNQFNVSTDVSGEYVFSDLEEDAYTASSTGYDIAEACPANPVTVPPGNPTTQDLVLVPNTTNTLRVAVETSSGAPIFNSSVTLSRSGFSDTKITSSCGQVFFSSLSSATDYILTVVASGYSTITLTDQTVQNDQVTVVQF